MRLLDSFIMDCYVVTKMEKVVSETKRRAEVTERYMQKWDEIEHIKRDGREEVNRLNSILIDAGRMDDLARATKDPEYQKKLMEELLQKKG